MNAIFERILSLYEEAERIWLSGGWPMIAIAIVGVIMFGVGVHVWLRLGEKGFQSVPERTWRRWIDHPAERRGPIGAILDLVTDRGSIDDTAHVFHEIRAAEVAPFARDLKIMKICVTAAPLLGLLGTVLGMLTTFGALASGSGGEKTMTMVAGGISKALVTTETGLVVALAGLFFQYVLVRKHERYKAFLAHLETVCTQAVYWKLGKGSRTADAA